MNLSCPSSLTLHYWKQGKVLLLARFLTEAPQKKLRLGLRV